MFATFQSLLPSSLSFSNSSLDKEKPDRINRHSQSGGEDLEPVQAEPVNTKDDAEAYDDGRVKGKDMYRRKREKHINETFIVVRPPPSVSNHPLNLQLQLVPPHIKDKERSSRASIDVSPEFSADNNQDDANNLQRVQSNRSNRSDVSASLYSSYSSTQSVSSFASTSTTSTTSTASGRRTIIPLYNLHAHNVMTNTICDAGTDAKVVKFHKRGMEVLGFAVLEPVEVWGGVGGHLQMSQAQAQGQGQEGDGRRRSVRSQASQRQDTLHANTNANAVTTPTSSLNSLSISSNTGHAPGESTTTTPTSSRPRNYPYLHAPPGEEQGTPGRRSNVGNRPGTSGGSETDTPNSNSNANDGGMNGITGSPAKKIFGRLFKKRDSPLLNVNGTANASNRSPSVSFADSDEHISPPNSATGAGFMSSLRGSGHSRSASQPVNAGAEGSFFSSLRNERGDKRGSVHGQGQAHGQGQGQVPRIVQSKASGDDWEGSEDADGGSVSISVEDEDGRRGGRKAGAGGGGGRRMGERGVSPSPQTQTQTQAQGGTPLPNSTPTPTPITLPPTLGIHSTMISDTGAGLINPSFSPNATLGGVSSPGDTKEGASSIAGGAEGYLNASMSAGNGRPTRYVWVLQRWIKAPNVPGNNGEGAQQQQGAVGNVVAGGGRRLKALLGRGEKSGMEEKESHSQTRTPASVGAGGASCFLKGEYCAQTDIRIEWVRAQKSRKGSARDRKSMLVGNGSGTSLATGAAGERGERGAGGTIGSMGSRRSSTRKTSLDLEREREREGSPTSQFNTNANANAGSLGRKKSLSKRDSVSVGLGRSASASTGTTVGTTTEEGSVGGGGGEDARGSVRSKSGRRVRRKASQNGDEFGQSERGDEDEEDEDDRDRNSERPYTHRQLQQQQQEDDEPDSDPEDSETPWTCVLTLIPKGYYPPLGNTGAMQLNSLSPAAGGGDGKRVGLGLLGLTHQLAHTGTGQPVRPVSVASYDETAHLAHLAQLQQQYQQGQGQHGQHLSPNANVKTPPNAKAAKSPSAASAGSGSTASRTPTPSIVHSAVPGAGANPTASPGVEDYNEKMILQQQGQQLEQQRLQQPIRLKLASLAPAPHHPKIVAQLKVAFPLPDVDVDAMRVRKRTLSPSLPANSGAGVGPMKLNKQPLDPRYAGMTVTAEELKDVLCATAFWLVVREGFGGVGYVRRKGDGWRIRG